MKISHIDASSKKRLIVIRHEPTRENNLGIIQGQSIGGTLASKEINPDKVKWCKENIFYPAIIVSSAATRAKKSARCFSEILDIPLYTSHLFIQRGWGDVEGRHIKEIRGRFPKNAFLADTDELSNNAESLREVMQRAHDAWEYLKKFNTQTILLVTHDEFSNYLINEILNEGLFKRPLKFNEAHLIELVNNEPNKVILHANIYPVPIERRVLLRSDSQGFISDKIGLRILRNYGIAVVNEKNKSEKINPHTIEGIIIGDKPFIIDKEVREYPNLKVVARLGKGVDNVRIKRNKKLSGLYVTNTPDCNERAVAEFTVALIANLIRDVHNFNREINKGNFSHCAFAKEWRQMKIGIVGLGRIGKEVAIILKDMKFSVYVWTVHPAKHSKFLKKTGIHLVKSPSELCSICDVVSLHVRLTDKTRNLIGIKELEAMKVHCGCLVNTSRSGLLDYKALKVALKKGWICGAALDVWPEEPIESKRLKELSSDPKIIATPHIAGRTKIAINKAISLCGYNIAWVLSGIPEITTSVPLEELRY